jgi:hypothetical protein
MNQFPNGFDRNGFSDDLGNNLRKSEIDIESDRELENVSMENLAKTKQQLRRIFLILLGFGLGVGIFVSIGVVAVMNYFNLKEIPQRQDKIELPQQKNQTDLQPESAQEKQGRDRQEKKIVVQ